MNANLLKSELVRQGVSVDVLSERTGINRATLYRLLKNIDKVRIGDAKKIKAALNMSDETAVAIFLLG